MKIQFVFDDHWKRVGIAITLLDRGVLLLSGAKDREYRRICDFCTKKEAIVYCQSHACYACDSCLGDHTSTKPEHERCHFISMAVCRDLATKALNRAPGRRFADNFYRMPISD